MHKGTRFWFIDDEGRIHWPGIGGQTFCRRPSKSMERSARGDFYCTCEACRELYTILSRQYGTFSPWDKFQVRRIFRQNVSS
jgi:hypothetical protein